MRQHRIGNYVVDFYCHEARLIIEIDGSVHGEEEVKERDIARQKELEEPGYSFVRFSNKEVVADVEKVILILLDILPPPLFPREGGVKDFHPRIILLRGVSSIRKAPARLAEQASMPIRQRLFC